MSICDRRCLRVSAWKKSHFPFNRSNKVIYKAMGEAAMPIRRGPRKVAEMLRCVGALGTWDPPFTMQVGSSVGGLPGNKSL